MIKIFLKHFITKKRPKKSNRFFYRFAAVSIINFITLIQPSQAATVTVVQGATVSSSTANGGDTVNFTGGSTGTFNMNQTTTPFSLSLSSITTVTNNVGTVNYLISNPNNQTLTVTGDIGATLHALNTITFSSAGNTLNAQGNIFTQNGIVGTQSGTLILNGSLAQSVNGGDIGTSSIRHTVTSNSAGGVTFNADVFASAFNSPGVSSIGSVNTITVNGDISGSGRIDGVGTLVLDGDGTPNQLIDPTIGSSGNRLSAVNVSNSANTATFSQNLFTTSFANSGTVVVGDGRTFDISGNVTGTGTFKDSTGLGSINFSGSSNQTVASKIGTVSDVFNNITITNGTNKTVSLNNDVFVTNIVNSSSGTINVASGKTLTINKDTAGKIDGASAGVGTVSFAGGGGHVISSVIGGARRLDSVSLAASDTATASGNITTNDLTSAGTFNISGTVDVAGNLSGAGILQGSSNNTGELVFSGFAITHEASLNLGSTTNRLLRITTNGINTANLNNNTYTQFLVNTGFTKIGTTLDVSGDISGTGTLDAKVGGSGTLVLSGTTTQTNSTVIGGTARLGNLTISNAANVVTSTANITAGNLNNSGSLVLSGVTLDLNGNITGSGTVKGVSDNSGSVIFSGTSAQTVSSSTTLGTANNSLSSITTNNTTGLTISGNIDTAAFAVNELTTIDGSGTVSLGTLTIGSSKTLNLSNNASSSGVTFSAGAALINIASGKTLTLSSGNISVTAGTGSIQGQSAGVGALTLSGSSAQTISSNIGSTNRLSDINFTNTAGITLSASNTITTTNLNNSSAVTLGSGAALDVSGNMTGSGTYQGAADNNGTLTLSGSTSQSISNALGTLANSLSSITVSNSGNTATFNDNVFVNSVTNAGTINIASGKTFDISSTVSGAGTFQGASAGVGSLKLSGTSAQTITSDLGTTRKLNNITVTNSHASGATFSGAISTNSLTVSGNTTISGTAAVDIGATTINSSKSLTISNSNATFSSVTTSSDGTGTLVLNSSTAQTVNAIGANGAKLALVTANNTNGVTFSGNLFATSLTINDKNITLNGSNVDVTNGITTTTTGNGSVTIGGSSAQTIAAQIGTGSIKVNQINITNSSTAGVTMTKDLFALGLALNGNNLTLSNNANINTTNGITTSTNNTGSITFSGTTAQTVASKIGTSSLKIKDIIVNNTNASGTKFTDDVYTTNLTVGTGALADITSNKTLSIAGNIVNSGTIQSSDGTGNINLFGTTAQTIGAIGTSSNKINIININNTSGALTLSGNIFADGINVNNDIDITISSNLTLTSGISGAGSDVNLTLNGSGIQTIDASINIGSDLTINNTNTVSFTKDITADNIDFDATMAASAARILTFNGSAAQNIIANIGSLTHVKDIVASNTDATTGLVFNGDITTDTIHINGKTSFTGSHTVNLGAIVIGNNGQITIDSSVTSFGTITGGGTGSVLTFGGSAAQTVSSAIGSSSSRIGTINVTNTNSPSGVLFNDNVFAVNYNATTDSDGITRIAAGKTLDISGTVGVVGSGGDGSFQGASDGAGNLVLSGTAVQTITNNFGNLTNSKLASVSINNSTANIITLNNTTIATTLNVNGKVTLSNTGTLNVTNVNFASNDTNTNPDNNSLTIGDGTITIGSITTGSITTGKDDFGSLIYVTSAPQTINYAIGTASKKLHVVEPLGSAVTFKKDIYTHHLELFFNDATIDLDPGSTADIGNVTSGQTFFSGHTLTLASDATMNDVDINAGGLLVINSGKTAFIKGNVGGDAYADGTIHGASAGVGNINFNGTTAQTVNSKIGVDDTDRLNTITVSNTHASGVTFTNEIYTSNFAVNGKAVITGSSIVGSTVGKLQLHAVTIGTGGELVLTNVNAAYDSINVGLSTSGQDNGKITYNSTANQTENWALGDSTHRFGTVAVTKSSGTMTFNDNIFTRDLTTYVGLQIKTGKTFDVAGDIVAINSGAIDGESANTGTLTFSGTVQNIHANIGGTNRLATTNITNGSQVFTTGTLFTTNLVSNGILSTNSSINVTGNITSTGTIQGTTDGAGSLTLSGTSAQAVNNKIGTASNSLGSVTISNTHSGGVTTFTNDIDVGSFAVGDDTTITGSGTVSLGNTTIASSKTLALINSSTMASLTNSGTLTISTTAFATGNISGSGTIHGVTPSTGSLNLSGSSAQTINSKLGASSDKLNTITISNTHTNGVTFTQDIYTDNFLVTGKAVIAGSNGSGTIMLGAVTIGNSGELVLTNASATYTGNITNSSGSKITFNSASAQTNSTTLGASNNRYDTVTINNSAGVTLNQTFTKNLVLATGSLTKMAQNQTMDVTGDISGSGIIKGNNDVSNTYGGLSLNGSTAQSISANIGSSSATIDKLNVLTVTNTDTISGVTFSGNIFNNNFTVSGKTTLSGSGTMQIGATSVSSGKTLTIANDVTATTLANSGIININSGKTFTLNSTIVTVTGTVGIAIIDSSLGKIHGINTTLSVTNGTTFNFDYSNSNDIDPSGNYLFLDSTGTLTATAASLVATDNSFLIQSTIVKNGNSLRLQNTLDNSVLNQLSPTDRQNLITISDNNIATTGSNMATVQNQLMKINNITTLNTALDTLKPTADNAPTITSLAVVDQVNRIINLRLSALSAQNGFDLGYSNSFNGQSDLWNRNSLSGNLFASSSQGYSFDEANKGKLAVAASKALPNNYEGGNQGGVWGQIFASKIKQDAAGSSEGYDTSLSGLIFGGDKYFKNNGNKYTFGGAFTYSNASVSNSSKNKVNSYQIALYNHNSKSDELGLYNDNIINIGYNKYSSSRTIQVGTFNANANADYNGNQYGLKTLVGYNYGMKNTESNDQMMLTPYFSLRYSKINQSGYDEQGAGNVGLHVESTSADSITSGLGGKVTYKTSYNKVDIIPTANIEWMHNLKDGSQAISSSFIAGGPSMSTSAPSMTKDIYNLGMEMIFPELHSNNYTTIRYDLQQGSGYQSHTISAKYRMEF